MVEIEGIFHHKEALKIIDTLSKPRWGILSKKSSPLDKTKAFIKPRNKGFSLAFQYDIFTPGERKLNVGQYQRKIEFTIKGKGIVLEDMFLNYYSPPKYGAQVSFLYSKGFSKRSTYYYRLIIPLKEELKFHYQIEETLFSTDLGYRSRTSSQANINNDAIFLCVINRGREEFFLSVESRIKQSFESFSNKAHAVINGLGFISGYLPGDMGYYFAYTTKHMKTPKYFYCCEFRDTIRAMLTPISSNPYSYLTHKKAAAKKYQNKKILRCVKISEFSNLCQHLHDSVAFSGTILLILESSVASLLFRPGGYAMALEAISDIIMKGSRTNIAPIKDKALSRKIVKECQDIITKHCATLLDADTLSLLNSRIGSNLNKPTNKAQLKAPFDFLKINLRPRDLQVLETRNDLLHGRYPDITEEGKLRTNDRINRDLYYVSLRFYTLLNMVILKWCGFDGHIINHPKIQERYCKIKLKEDYFRKV